LPATLPPELAARWPHVKTLIEVSSERTEGGRSCSDARRYLSSLPVDARQAAHAVRRHWGIENELHWVLDVVFREDELRVADPEGAAQLALFNRVALSVIRQHTKRKDSVAGKRQRAAWDPRFRTELLFD
ncbi:ISAs1 family transposase, partial [Chitinivorax sp. B]|uniref:ISAs1 family transposase n=1 Tax=Chitinivorax sp. B TaxID=2502235 RepID=UPI001BB19D05